MADIGFALLTPTVVTEPFLLYADPNPSVTSIHQKIMSVRSYLAGKDHSLVWFKYFVKSSTAYSKEFILRNLQTSLLQSGHRDFSAVKFHTANGDSIFYSKHCSEQVMVFIRQNCTVRVPVSNVTLNLVIEVGTRDDVPEININDLVALIVQRRVVSSTMSSLDLSSFHLEPELDAYCFFPLSTSNNLQKVIRCADHFAITPFTSLNLSNNKIKHLSCFNETVQFKLGNFANLRCLDLRNNELTMPALQSITHLPLLEMKLDGNPLCSLYDKEFEYVKDIQCLFKTLKTLDGCTLSSPGLLLVRPFHCINPHSQHFLEEFLTHYFSIYDSDKRHLLYGLYHSEALFSLTSTFLAGQSTSTNANLADYLNESRNCKKLSDWGKLEGHLYKGTKQIIDLLKKLPRTQHDVPSFSADVLIFNPTCIKISVTGLFREPDNTFASTRYFKRNFVLYYFNKVYLIVNDIMFITNSTSEQAVSAFRIKSEPSTPLNLYLTTRATHLPLSNEQKVNMIEKISDITNMNQEWSQRCLEDVQYDLRNALVHFQKLYSEKSVPGEAFVK